ncbi:hypothetical protein PybrP1_006620 [[Pythium] brassicae (nom. inval.)]|nr:hypothetical protein PybrP1_006620 [[Pythium] brassicae (nom. inval.)]
MATPAHLRRRKPDGAGTGLDVLPPPARLPRREPSGAVQSPTAYEAMSTPPARSPVAAPIAFPPRRYDQAASERSMAPSAARRPSALARALKQTLFVLGSAVFPLCLLAAVGVRADLVSLVYLLVFCVGVVATFASRALAALTLVVALAAAAMHGALIYLFAHQRATAERWTRSTAASLLGMREARTAREHLATVGVDALVGLAAAFQLVFVAFARRAQEQEQAARAFDAFAFTAADGYGGDGDVVRPTGGAARFRSAVLLQRVEVLCAALLFLTAMSVPALATGAYFVVLLLRLVNWTFFTKKVTLAQLIYHDSTATHKALFLGPAVAELLLALSVLVLVGWYAFQINDIRTNATAQNVAKYAGFVDFRAAHVEWSFYLFATCQFLLFTACAQLRNLHRAAAKHRDVFHLDDEPSAAPLPALGPEAADVDVQYLLSKQPFLVRAFLQEGGLLLASAAAIVWCVSYPSYGSLPLIAWAFLSLALYGLSSPAMVIWVLILYGTCLSVAEYVSNLTANIIGAGYAQYGLKAFDYPFLDLSVHNICLVFIYYSIRTRWQYQGVLREYRRQRDTVQLKARASEVSRLSELGDSGEDRSTMADLRQQAHIVHELKLGWGKILELWIRDSKQVIFTHLDALVLLTIIVVAISTNVSFLQIGYLVLAVLLIFFFDHRRRLWRVLLLYALAACLAVFVRNIKCEPNADLDLLGLECYSSTSETWGSLWPTLFSAQLLIIVQLVFQLVIYVANKDAIDERLRSMDQARQHPIYFVSRLGVEIDNVFRAGGVLVCYVAFLLVAVQYERGSSRLNTNVVGAVQLVLLFVLLGSHLGGFPTAPRTSLRMKVLWSFALLVEILLLVARYVYQFDQVTTYLDKHVFTPDFMTARDFGFENHASGRGLSGLFLYLLPTALVMALCFWQLASLLRDVHPYDVFAAGRSRRVDRLRFALQSLQQVLSLCSTTALVVVAMWAAVDEIDFVGELYVLTLVVGRALATSWKSLWFPLFWVSALALVLKYAVQLDAFSPDAAGVRDTLFRAGDSSDWVGMVRLPERFDPSVGAARLWTLLSRQLLVMLMCCVQRVAQYFDAAAAAKRARATTNDVDALVARFEANYARRLEEGGPPKRRTSSVEAYDDDDDNDDRTHQVAHDDDTDVAGTFLGEPAAPAARAAPRRTRALHLQQQAPPETPLERDFFTCLRDFCMDYASKASVNFVMLLFTVACFVRQDAISVLYMALVYSMMYASAATVCARWWLLAALLSLLIVVQYSVMLWLPPALDVAMQDTPPWSFVPRSHQQWFVLSNQHKWGVMADFVTLLSVYLLPDSNRLGDAAARATDDHTAESSASFLAASAASSRGDKAAAVLDYEMLTRRHLWHYLEFAFLAAWLPLVLVLVFLVGAQQGGLASVPYLLGSVVMLYRLDDARAPASPWIQYLRKWNWAHLFAIVLLYAPYLTKPLTDCKLGGGGAGCVSVANVLGLASGGAPVGLIVVFALISVQCEVLLTPTYRDVNRLLQRDRDRAPVRREEIVRDFYRRRTAQWFALKKEKSAAIQRLKLIVSKLVHKVEELMDIAMGLHYNLPPMAPSRPTIVECSQNAVTLAWEPPSNTLHKIRFYRITRQVYPSMTLLGDFGDLVELKGDATHATIQGLRPGTTYQFKVCAVSRMGEGPFSLASDPVATFSLNFDGNTTAGWMKYRREQVPRPRLAFLVAWMQPTFLHRYVVMDKRHLVYYKDEEVALKHRSRTRRKKLKTAFLWKDVVSLRLSDAKVQFDDLSPMLYCFEVVVRHDGARRDAKYVFQANIAKDFNKFLTTLAFAVPLDAVDDSVVACLVDKKLPNPRDAIHQAHAAAADDGDAVDEAASEWSSVTGDESALGDKEDEEFDQSSPRGLLAWRIPVYRLLYGLQNAAFQLETVQYEVEDQYEPSVGELVQIVTNVVRSSTAGIACGAMVLSFACQADLLNMVLVLAAFCFLVLESPRPNSLAWIYVLNYSYAVIVLRYAFQLSIFCLQLSDDGVYYPSVQPRCAATDNSVALIEIKPIQPMVLLGLYKFDGSALDSVTSVFGGLQWNFYVVLCVMWHRRELISQGLWVEANAAGGDDNGDSQRSFQSDAVRALRASQASSRDSIDDAFRSEPALPPPPTTAGGDYHPGIMRPAYPLPPSSTMDRTSRPTLSLAPSQSFGDPTMSNAQAVNELAAAFLEEIEAEAEDAERKKAEAALAAAAATGGGDTGDESDEVGTPPTSPPESNDPAFSAGTNSARKTVSFLPAVGSPNVVAAASEQVEIEDSVDLDFPQRKKLSWWERTFPRASQYLDAVLCRPPPQWDKDIHIAITGEKPGRDFYTASLSLQLVASVFAVIFFTALGEPDPSNAAAATADTRLTSSSMISAYLVLLVLLEVTVIIWDRVAYVCRSLGAKLALQYAHAIVLHVCVGWLIPRHANVYFQHRPALVLFYALHCACLWLGALQVRYGYPAFSGSKYNYTIESAYTKANEALFPLVMAAPFLFEMRALLDYVCTKTSLSWAHWVLLEDVAAHLFQVKMEMQGRVAKAEVLQGKQRQPLGGKLASAGAMLLFLLVCLVGPLALFSSANPSTTENKVTLTEVVFGITDAQGTLSKLYSNSDINSPTFALSRNTDGAAVQRLEFDAFSREVWASSPPRVNQLVAQLQSTEALNWTMEFAFERPGPTDNQNVKVTYSAPLTEAHRNDLIPMIKQRVDDAVGGATIPAIRVDSFFPPILQLTATAGVLRRSLTLRALNVSKHALDGVTWWSVLPLNGTTAAAAKENYCSGANPFCLVVVSDNIVDGLNALGVGSYGLTAVYVFVVMTIGGAVKGFFRGAYLQVQYAELPDPGDVLELIEGIYIAREEKYVGHLKDEVRIFETLIRVLRSPETLVKVTGTNVIHIPAAKEKID